MKNITICNWQYLFDFVKVSRGSYGVTFVLFKIVKEYALSFLRFFFLKFDFSCIKSYQKVKLKMRNAFVACCTKGFFQEIEIESKEPFEESPIMAK